MTDAELDSLEAAAKAATPGPWEDLSNHPDHLRGTINRGAKHIAICGYLDTWEEERRVTLKEMLANAAYIAAANPSAILSLIAELRQARTIAEASYGMVKEAVDRAAAKEATRND